MQTKKRTSIIIISIVLVAMFVVGLIAYFGANGDTGSTQHEEQSTVAVVTTEATTTAESLSDSSMPSGGDELSSDGPGDDSDSPLFEPAIAVDADLEDSEQKTTETTTEATTENDYVEYTFRNQKRLDEHYEKHGKDMGFKDAKSYEKAASDVVNDSRALHKIEKEDGDDVYYIEDTNDFVIVSPDGYIRTYFWPNDGIKYYNKQ
ncbi:MAG: hypothetical protein K6E27_06010 [Eubacterium sp.]|nr:hypothetical protein [Eubacterium sp.]